ncbi:MAG: YCF48-related protein [Fidelibacterota bacterium]
MKISKIISLILCVLIAGTAFAKWEQLDFPVEEALWHIRFANPDIGWVVSENHLYKTEDGGQTWNEQLESLGRGVLHVKDENTLLLTNFDYGADDESDGILMSKDGGQSWQVVLQDDIFIHEFDFVSDQVGYAGGGDPDFNPLIKKTTDGGETWTTVCDNFPETDYEIMGISFINATVGWAVSYHGYLYKTTDGGNSWTFMKQMKLDSDKPSIRDVEFVNSQKGIVIGGIAGCSLVWTTEDGGETWTYHEEFQPGRGSSMNEVQFIDENTCWMVGYGMPSTVSVVSTPDFGQTWEGHFEEMFNTITEQQGCQSLDMVSENIGYFVSNNIHETLGKIVKYSTSEGVTTTDDPKQLPLKYQLNQNYPNPFNPTTTISYTLPKQEAVKVAIYDAMGNLVEVIEQGNKPAGYHRVEWNAGNHSTGVYFYKLEIGEFTSIKKCVFMK